MKAVQIVFSPTGGTRKVSETIISKWNIPVDEIDLTNPQNDFSKFDLKEDDIAVISVPSYGGRVPSLAAERLKKIQGNGIRCIVVCVYGNRAYEDTLIELSDIAKQSGFRVVSAVCAIAEHSIISKYATGRPDEQDQDELKSFGEKIFEKINNNNDDDVSELKIPGNRPYKKEGGGGLIPKANKDCTNCGLCAKNCPAQAIEMTNPKMTDSKKCISCMRCVKECPQSARRVNAVMVSIGALALKKACSVRKNNELYI